VVRHSFCRSNKNPPALTTTADINPDDMIRLEGQVASLSALNEKLRSHCESALARAEDVTNVNRLLDVRQFPL
jgi:hypothetical protein